MCQLIVQTIKLDVEMKKKELRDIFFSSLVTMIKTKIFYQIQMMDEDNTFKTIFNQDRGGAKAAVAYLCISIFTNADNTCDPIFNTLEDIQKYQEINREQFKI
jgi:hypothetical protein